MTVAIIFVSQLILQKSERLLHAEKLYLVTESDVLIDIYTRIDEPNFGEKT